MKDESEISFRLKECEDAATKVSTPESSVNAAFSNGFRMAQMWCKSVVSLTATLTERPCGCGAEGREWPYHLQARVENSCAMKRSTIGVYHEHVSKEEFYVLG